MSWQADGDSMTWRFIVMAGVWVAGPGLFGAAAFAQSPAQLRTAGQVAGQARAHLTPRGASWAEGEAQRDDENFAYAAAWQYQGPDKPPVMHKESLVYEEVHMSTRSYK